MKNFLKVIIALQFITALCVLFGCIPFELGITSLATIVVSPAPQRSRPSTGNVVVPPGYGRPDPTPANLRVGDRVTIKPTVQSMKVTVTSPPNGAAGPTVVFTLNQQRLQNILTNGGAALTYNYQDNFGGNQLSDMVGFANGAVGLPMYGLYMRFTADNVADPVGLSDAEPALLQYVGRALLSVPYIFDLDDNETRADNDDSIGVCNFDVPQDTDYNTQVMATINGDAAVTYRMVQKLYFTPRFKM